MKNWKYFYNVNPFSFDIVFIFVFNFSCDFLCICTSWTLVMANGDPNKRFIYLFTPYYLVTWFDHFVCLLAWLQVIHQLKQLGTVWQDVLPVSIYCKAMGSLLNIAITEVITKIMMLEVFHLSFLFPIRVQRC